ncbi:tol-pal system protein YbgF [Paramagnetospirillum kuznetsovii]|uniref:Cell division coordinator CpoB n=1 Tax=Paramagnetospirillum kuznetsovii TaxID=2053833 RepID=A0A364NUC9_9PROT|nr:tol-pal system protein YbgF [Paramagnetospirillum kuznetsovii]RAU20487.1 tol-pal system protein YbgF [Paramagnetospirillum kuznetsovii]
MRRIITSTVFVALLGGLVVVASAPAQAQSETRALYDRIERLERDLSIVQSQAARGGASPTVIRSPAANDGSVAGSMASRLEDRINELEDANRFLTGKIEEANFKTAQAMKQLERLQTDIDLRFKELLDARPQGSSSVQAPQSATQSVSMPATTPNGAPVLIPPKGVKPGVNSADNDGPAPGPQTLGQLSQKDAKKAEAQAQAAPTAAPAATPKDPQAAYDDAYSLAQKGDYDNAERGFQAFLKAFPNHQLAGNAQYWLGDIAFSQRKDFAQSAKLFGEAYKKYPKHTKAPDMLYKLGASFGQLDMKDQACRTYALLFAEHPGMADRIKRAATGDKQRLGCK